MTRYQCSSPQLAGDALYSLRRCCAALWQQLLQSGEAWEPAATGMGRCTAEVWSVHMWWWRCRWCAGMLIAVMKIWYSSNESSCPEFKRPPVVWHQTDIFFNTLVLLKTERSWQYQMGEIQFSVRIFLSWTSNQIIFIVLFSNNKGLNTVEMSKTEPAYKIQWKIEREEKPDHTWKDRNWKGSPH